MKILSLILSTVTFIATLCFLIFYFPDVSTFNGFIYFVMMLILLLICVTGIIINKPEINRVHNRFRINTKKEAA